MPTLVQRHWSGRIPPERPVHIGERHWRAFRGHVADGKTLAEVARGLGVSTGRARQLVYIASRHMDADFPGVSAWPRGYLDWLRERVAPSPSCASVREAMRG
jgi:hypothetical protein